MHALLPLELLYVCAKVLKHFAHESLHKFCFNYFLLGSYSTWKGRRLPGQVISKQQEVIKLSPIVSTQTKCLCMRMATYSTKTEAL